MAERDRIREKAYEDGLGAGRMEGRMAGAREGRDKVASETSGVTTLLKEFAGSLQKRRTELEGLAECELIRLAISIAERIVKVEVRARALEIAPANVRRAVELTVSRRAMIVCVNPMDLDAVKAHLPEVISAFPEAEGMKLQADESISRGGCEVITEVGTVDADLGTQLEEIERSLLG